MKLWTLTWRANRDQLHREGRREGPGVPRRPRAPTCRRPACAWASAAAAAPASSTRSRSTRSATTTRCSRTTGSASSSTVRACPYVARRDRRLRRDAAGRRLQGREPERGRGVRLRLLVPRGRRGRGLRRLAVRRAWYTRRHDRLACAGRRGGRARPRPRRLRRLRQAGAQEDAGRLGRREAGREAARGPGGRHHRAEPELRLAAGSSRCRRSSRAGARSSTRSGRPTTGIAPRLAVAGAGQPGKPNFEIPQTGCLRDIPPCASFGGPARAARGARRAARSRGGWQALMVVAGTPGVGGPSGLRLRAAADHAALARAALRRARRRTSAFIGEVLELARRVGADLRYWSPWNEPNHPYSLSPQRVRCRADAKAVAPARYAQLAGAMRQALDKAPGDQELVLGELAGLPKSRPFTSGIREFIRALPKRPRVLGDGVDPARLHRRRQPGRRRREGPGHVLLPAEARDLDRPRPGSARPGWAASARPRSASSAAPARRCTAGSSAGTRTRG